MRSIDRPFEPGDELPSIQDSSTKAWEQAKADLPAGDEGIREVLRDFPDDSLDVPLASGGSSAYNNFHGYIQHAYYHAGQISVLKSLASSQAQT